MSVSARRAAFLALEAYRRRGARPDMALANIGELTGRERGLAANIVNGVLQNMAYLDYYISLYSGRAASGITPEALDILRLSAYQILFLDRVPVRAAVSEGTELAKREVPRAAGFVNAVLRKIGQGKDSLPAIAADSVEKFLAIKYSHPDWLVRRLIEEYGEDSCREILKADNTPAPVTAQVNTLKCGMAELRSSLEAQDVAVKACPYLRDAYYISGTGPIEELEAFKKGLFYVQDPAARFAVLAAGVKPGMRVLDLCAAPGGKSFAAAIAMRDRGEIRSFDIHERKAALIKRGADRLGITAIRANAGNARVFSPELEGWADVVIADVPCSGMGVIRKKPEIRYKDPGELDGLFDVQLDIIKNASRYVRPGGALVYSTCTVFKRENQDVVTGFLDENSDFEPEEFTLPEPFGVFPGMGVILQRINGTDGFFICLLRKKI